MTGRQEEKGDEQEGTRLNNNQSKEAVISYEQQPFASQFHFPEKMLSSGRRVNPILYRTSLQPTVPAAYPWRRILLIVPLAAILGVLLNMYFGVDRYDTSYQSLLSMDLDNKAVNQMDWCSQVERARADLSPSLHVQVPCQTMTPAKSAVVCMLTDGAAEEKVTRVVFSATDYIHGAMALGASLQGQIDPTQTHLLLLLRDGFVLAADDLVRLQSVGWIVGTAPNIPLAHKYLPRFPRYKTTYTKVSAIGLAEYDCVMLMDADTLAVGDLRELMSCSIFTEPQHRVAATLDLYSGHWHFFNTGSLLWKTSSKEMDRVFALTQDSSWMKAFSSDQEFLNNVYPERLNNTLNKDIIEGKAKHIPGAEVVDMGWGFNAQTHVEVAKSDWWESMRPDVKILHYTEKKGWQCEERHQPPPPLSEMPPNCKRNSTIPICFCREAHLYWDALNKAKAAASQALALTGG